MSFFGQCERSGEFGESRVYHHRYTQNQQTPPHEHDQSILYWVRAGFSRDQRRDTNLAVAPGDLVFLEVGETHATHWHCDGLLLHVEGPAGEGGAAYRHAQTTGRLHSRLSRLEQELNHWDDLSPSIAHELALNLWTGEIDGKQTVPSWLQSVDKFLFDRSSDTFTLESIADHVGLHPTHLSRAYVQWTGLTLSEQLRFNRLRKAAGRLRSEINIPIGHIALQEGFYDQSHFSKQFKTAFGMTPIAYRTR